MSRTAQATTENPEAPRFTVDLYKDMARRGLLLDDFLQEQFNGLREWQPEMVDSGLVLDLLAYPDRTCGCGCCRVVQPGWHPCGDRF